MNTKGLQNTEVVRKIACNYGVDVSSIKIKQLGKRNTVTLPRIAMRNYLKAFAADVYKSVDGAVVLFDRLDVVHGRGDVVVRLPK